MSNSNNNQINIPQAREAMDRFKMLINQEVGSVGGQMVKKISPVRSTGFKRQKRIAIGGIQTARYIASIIV